ncbi:MAG: hypothetical protein ABSB24_02855 [Gaiellaceae bacterium]|jgi:hypothetical protein
MAAAMTWFGTFRVVLFSGLAIGSFVLAYKALREDGVGVAAIICVVFGFGFLVMLRAFAL